MTYKGVLTLLSSKIAITQTGTNFFDWDKEF